VTAWPTATPTTPKSFIECFYVVTKQNAAFWGVGTRGGAYDPKFLLR